MIHGCARVSTSRHSVDAQVRQRWAAGTRQLFREVASGAKANRARLCKASDQLDPGDVLMVPPPDRLGGSARDLLRALPALLCGRPTGAPAVSTPERQNPTTIRHLQPSTVLSAGCRLPLAE